MLTYVFPGQGSQSKGMGEDLLNDFKTLTNIASDVLGYSLKELCLRDPDNRLRKTQYTQPALYVINALAYLKHYEITSQKSDYLAGHSLGEFNALFAAGVFGFETGLRLVKKRGELMSQSSAGAMAAVIGASIEDIHQVLLDHKLENIDIANLNSPEQVVISGARDEIHNAAPLFKKLQARYIPLQVSAAFHSRFMETAKNEFTEFLKPFTFEPPKIPVISNVHAQPYKTGQEKKCLCDQITHPVRWTESIDYLLAKGEMKFIELGPGNVLTNLVGAIKRREMNKKVA